MKLPRRKFMHLAAGAAALPVLSRIARAQTYPSRPVHWIVGYTPGGGNDTFARLMGQWLQERLGQPFVIENRPGAGSNIATEAVVNARPDGYTILLANFANASNASLYGKSQIQLHPRYCAGCGHRAGAQHHAGQSIPSGQNDPRIHCIRQGEPEQDQYGLGRHRLHRPFGRRTDEDDGGDRFVHVPYRGNAPAITDLLSGQVQIVFASLPSSIEYVRAGKARGLAVTTAMRAATAPDLPGIAEFVAGYEVSSWYGIGAPRNTPADVVDTLNEAVNAGLADPKLKKQLEDQGGIEMAGTPADFGKLIADETEKWAKVIKFAGIKPQ